MKPLRQIQQIFLSLVGLFVAACCLLVPGASTHADGAPNMTNLVVFVRFADDTDTDVFNESGNWAALLEMFTGPTSAPDRSFHHYIQTISDGALIVQNYFPQQLADGTGVATLTLPRTVSEYASGGADTVMIGDVIAAINDGTIPLDTASWTLNYRDGNYVDNLTIVVQGAPTSSSDFYYPHKSIYFGSDTVAGLQVGVYNVIDSMSLLDKTEDGYYLGSRWGVIAHEFLHSLGLPDLYRYSGDGEPVGPWDIMAQTSSFLQYPLAVLRHQLGWLTMDTITEGGTYTLSCASKTSGTRGFRLNTPLSSTEYFVVEYRKRSATMAGYEYKLPSDGLLIYRVDTTVSGSSNNAGENYIYIFRPGVTSPGGADDSYLNSSGARLNSVYAAAVDPSAGETGYGSTDLAAAYTNDTIYYADGSNSGIQLSNITLSEDGEELTFTVDFADYTSDEYWSPLTSAAVGASTNAASIAYHTGNSSVYSAITENTGDSNHVKVYRCTGSSWAQAGATLTGYSDPQLRAYGNELYLLCLSNNRPTMFKLSGTDWIKLWQSSYTEYDSGSIRFVEGDGLFVSCVNASGAMELLSGAGGSPVVSNLTAADKVTNPVVCRFGDHFYAVYSDYFAASPACNATVARCSVSGGAWESAFHRFSVAQTNSHAVATDGTRLFIYAGASGSAPLLSVFDGVSWSDETLPGELTNTLDTTLMAKNGIPYICSVTGQGGKVRVFTKTDSGWRQLGSDVFASQSAADAVLSGDTIYVAAYGSNTGAVYVRYHAVQAATTPTTPSYVVTVTPPSGYTDTTLWIDGVAYPATQNGGALSVTLQDGSAASVEMYLYNANRIPTGMYVWLLSYKNDAYQATAMPALADLLTYHGFSVRVAGGSGIRFKTGISAATRAALLSADGISGYRLVEYGTLAMLDNNRAQYPFVKGGTKVTSGRAYWKTGSTVNDKIFETVGERYRFTSVLVDLPVSAYKTDFAFRGYILLDNGTRQILLYGPVRASNIYTISQLVLASNQFAAGSSADLFLRKIISDADGQ